MENYRENIYPTWPKDGDGETFRLQQTCDALQKLENETKLYETVRKKYKRYHDFLSKVSVSAGTLSFISSAALEMVFGPPFLVLAFPLEHHWERLD